jgi:uncharacterized membrane protein
MKPLYVLLVVFLIAMGTTLLIQGRPNLILAGNIAMSAMLIFTATGHFAFIEGMAMMVPDFIPFKRTLVVITGVIEIISSILLLISDLRYDTGCFLILFLIAILPANIYSAFKKVDYQKGSFDGPGLAYLWIRMPLQLFFIAWIWYFSVAR